MIQVCLVLVGFPFGDFVHFRFWKIYDSFCKNSKMATIWKTKSGFASLFYSECDEFQRIKPIRNVVVFWKLRCRRCGVS